MDLSARTSALHELESVDIESPVGGRIELYCEQYPVTQNERPIFERFLDAKSVQNRSAALAALVICGKFAVYEAAALQLHYDSRDGYGSAEEFAAINYLRKMSNLGNVRAHEILIRLDADPYIEKLYGG